MSTTVPAVPFVAAPKVSWLKSFGRGIWNAASSVIHFLGGAQVQKLEVGLANLASLLLPAEAPIIQAFQGIMGRIFQQAVVTETQMANVGSAGAQKLEAVVAAIGPELDAWVANNFPGSATVSKDVKAGLINSIVALQNALTAPPAPPTLPPAK
jgi:hypothetical protein